MRWMTALFAACTVAAWIALAHGDPAAANGVVGAGPCTILCAVLALIEGPQR